ncbi:MAG: hypothetical protein ACREML_09810, partial [Vulcanimicrobiaceae bacterium]
ADLSALWNVEPPAAHAPSVAVSMMPSIGAVYGLVVPELLRLLQEPLTAKELATAADLTKSQADVWLKRLVSEGRVQKTKAKYRATNLPNQQPSLF